MSDTLFDIIIVGAGPAGIAVGLAAKQNGLSILLIDRGMICNTIYYFPERMTFFSSADLLEFPGRPFVISGFKPSRHEALDYFTRMAVTNKLPVATLEEVLSVKKDGDEFTTQTTKRMLRSRAVVLATGTFDNPNLLNVPGEDLPHVSHYFRSTQLYIGKRVVIVGGKNSAAEAALHLYRAGATVTLVHRKEAVHLSQSVKYWLLPDLMNRIEEGAIRFIGNATVKRIEPNTVLIETPDGEQNVDCEFVFSLTGYRPDYEWLEKIGIEFSGEDNAPVHDPKTLETTIPGLYIAGVLTSGGNPSKVFIENSKFHGDMILNHLLSSGRLKAHSHV